MNEEKRTKSTRKNPQLDRGYYYGDIERIAQLSGYSRDMVRKVLIYDLRRNKKIVEVARKYKESFQSLKTA